MVLNEYGEIVREERPGCLHVELFEDEFVVIPNPIHIHDERALNAIRRYINDTPIALASGPLQPRRHWPQPSGPRPVAHVAR